MIASPPSLRNSSDRENQQVSSDKSYRMLEEGIYEQQRQEQQQNSIKKEQKNHKGLNGDQQFTRHLKIKRRKRIKGSSWAVWNSDQDRKLIELYPRYGNKFQGLTQQLIKEIGQCSKYQPRKVQSRLTSLMKFGLDVLYETMKVLLGDNSMARILDGRPKFVFAEKLLRAQDPHFIPEKVDIFKLKYFPNEISWDRRKELIEFVHKPVPAKHNLFKLKQKGIRRKKSHINSQRSRKSKSQINPQREKAKENELIGSVERVLNGSDVQEIWPQNGGDTLEPNEEMIRQSCPRLPRKLICQNVIISRQVKIRMKENSETGLLKNIGQRQDVKMDELSKYQSQSAEFNESFSSSQQYSASNNCDNSCHKLLYALQKHGNNYKKIGKIMKHQKLYYLKRTVARIYLKGLRAFQKIYKVTMVDESKEFSKAGCMVVRQLAKILAEDSTTQIRGMDEKSSDELKNSTRIALDFRIAIIKLFLTIVEDKIVDKSFLVQTLEYRNKFFEDYKNHQSRKINLKNTLKNTLKKVEFEFKIIEIKHKKQYRDSRLQQNIMSWNQELQEQQNIFEE